MNHPRSALSGAVLARKAAMSIASVVVIVALMLGLVIAAQPAYAQDSAPLLEASSHDLTIGDVFTARVSFNPNNAEVGAVSIALRFDNTSLEAQSCTAVGTGVCHMTPGVVHLAVVDTNQIDATNELLAVDFAVLPTAATSELTIDANAIATSNGVRLGGVTPAPGLITVNAPVALGGLNGEVLDADGAGVFNANVCAIDDAGAPTCTTTTGLGAFSIDGLPSGDYLVTISDPLGAFAEARLDATVAAPDVTTGLWTTVSPSDPSSEAINIDTDETVTTNPDGAAGTDALATDPTSADPASADPASADTATDDTAEPAALPALAPLASLTAEVGEILVRVVGTQGAPLVGAEVCATVPVIGTKSCGTADDAGLIRLGGLSVSNYLISAADPQFRFVSPEPLLVGLNAGAGVVAEILVDDSDLGDPPEALAYVLSADSSSTTTAVTATALGLVALTAMASSNRRSSRRER